MTDTLATHRAWVQALTDNRSRELTEWEESFVASVARHIEAGRFLSDKQAAILERIYAEKTA